MMLEEAEVEEARASSMAGGNWSPLMKKPLLAALEECLQQCASPDHRPAPVQSCRFRFLTS